MDGLFIPVFESFDIPNDIVIISYETTPIFQINLPDNSIIQFAIKFAGNTFRSYSVQLDGCIISENQIFETINYIGNNLNDYLWRISNCSYSMRMLKREILIRLSSVTDISEMEKIREIISDFSKPTIEDLTSESD